MDKRLFTSESVTEGHPDKLCDAVSDAILDALMEQDPMSRVACETATCTGFVLVTGEITTKAQIDIPQIVRDTVNEIGYNDAATGFDGNTCAVMVALDRQSADIAMGVDKALEAKENKMSDKELEAIGAGDQGMMFGYACSETEELMPLPITLAHKLTKELAAARKTDLPFLRPDGKAMVALDYENGEPVRVSSVVVSAQHAPDVSQEKIREAVIERVIKRVVPQKLLKGADIFVNPTGRFVVGGPAGDTGVTGRKIIVDTYGGAIPHGGGAFSGKDASKVDRSASYYARYVCKNVVAAGLCSKMMLQVGYAIGKARPVSLFVDTFGTGDDERIRAAVERVFDFRPAALIDKLGLKKPIFRLTTNYGHFGKAELAWEKTDAVEAIKAVY